MSEYDAVLEALAREFTTLTASLSDNTADIVLQQRLVEVAAQAIPGAEEAAVTVIVPGRPPKTSVSTGDAPRQVDQLQYEFNEGPCLQAIAQNDIAAAPDLTRDRQWPRFAAATVARTPIRSMLSFRLALAGQRRAALNLYARQSHSFSPESVSIGAILAAYSSLALRAAESELRAANLMRALESNREIGVAMGILMATSKITQEQAFDRLRLTSESLNVKLADIATQVALTGQLPGVERSTG